MFAVMFEVQPHPNKWECYLDVARMLRPELERIEGFLENTRYRSLSRSGVLLSLSLWRDEKAVVRWRTHAAHFAGQTRGRAEILADYRLRVGEVATIVEGGQSHALPAQGLDETLAGDARAIVFRLGREGKNGDSQCFASALATEHFVGLVDAADRAAMASFCTMSDAEAAVAVETRADRQLAVRVIRDYGLMDRREAPQFHNVVR